MARNNAFMLAAKECWPRVGDGENPCACVSKTESLNSVQKETLGELTQDLEAEN